MNAPIFPTYFVNDRISNVWSFFGMAHSPDKGAKLYIDALVDHETYKSGKFYGYIDKLGGKYGDQAELTDPKIQSPELNDTKIQDNVKEAIHSFL